MEHVWTVLCKFSITDSESRNVSLIETLERLAFRAEENPVGKVLPLPFELVTTWWRSDLEKPEVAQARVSIRTPDGKISRLVGPLEYRVDLEQHGRFRATGKIGGLPFKGYGVYKFVVQLKVGNRWKDVTAVPLEVIELPPEGS